MHLKERKKICLMLIISMVCIFYAIKVDDYLLPLCQCKEMSHLVLKPMNVISCQPECQVVVLGTYKLVLLKIVEATEIVFKVLGLDSNNNSSDLAIGAIFW